MTTIAEKDRVTVCDVLADGLVEDVELLLFTRKGPASVGPGRLDGQTCDETRELLTELAALSDKLHLTVHDLGTDPSIATRLNVTRAPTVIIRRRINETEREEERDLGVRFVGMPGGYEFSTLVADIVDVSQGRTDFSETARGALQAIERPVHVQVFVTPGCPYCPRVARTAHQMAMLNPSILAEVVEANEFQDLSERYQVRSVPMTVINDRIQFVGSLSEAKVLEAVQEAVRRDA